MQINTWDLSGALVRIGDLAREYAIKANTNKDLGCTSMENMYRDYLWGLKRALSAINIGFDLVLTRDSEGYYRRIAISYWTTEIGMPWMIER